MTSCAQVTVIVPTTGSSLVRQALDSLQKQSYRDFEVWVVADGEQFRTDVDNIVRDFPEFKSITLPQNTGADGYNGHRIYAAFGLLTNSKYVTFLDEDNWVDATHLETMVALAEKYDLDCAISLRKLYSRNGDYLGEDNCESLGMWPVWNAQHHMADTSTMLVKNQAMRELSLAWMVPLIGDRNFFAALYYGEYDVGSTGRHTLNYRLGSTNKSTSWEFFEHGNNVMQQKYPDGLPWIT